MKKLALAIVALIGAFVLFLFIYIRSIDMSYVRDKVKAELENNLNGQVSIGELSISGLKSLVLENLVISQNGAKTLVLESLSFDLTLSDLVKSKLSFSSLDVSGLQVHLRKVGDAYNVQNLFKKKAPIKPSKKKVLSMVSTTDLSPLEIQSIGLKSVKVYFGDIHLLQIDASGNLSNGKLNFPQVKVSKDGSYISSKLFIDLNTKSGVLQLQESLIDLVQLVKDSPAKAFVSGGKASFTGDVKFNEKSVLPQIVMKVNDLVLSQGSQNFTFKPVEVLVQQDKIYSNVLGNTVGGAIECNLDLRKKGDSFQFKETNLNIDLDLKSFDSLKSGTIAVIASLSGSLSNPSLQSKISGKNISVKELNESFNLSGVANGNLSRFKLDHLNLVGTQGSKLAISASLTDAFQNGLGLISGSLSNLSSFSQKLSGSAAYNGELTIEKGLLKDSLIQLSTKGIVFDKQAIPNISTDLHLSTSADSLVIKRSPVLLANSDGQFLLDARLPFSGEIEKTNIQVKASSVVLRGLPYLLAPVTIKELYVSNQAKRLSINKLLGHVSGGQFGVSGVVDSSLPVDKMFQGNLHLKSLDLSKVSKDLPPMMIESFTLNPKNKFQLNLKTNTQHFIGKGLLSVNYREVLLSSSSKGGLDLSVFNKLVKKMGYKGVSGILTLNTRVDERSKLVVASISGKSLILPMTKDMDLLSLASLGTQATFSPTSNILNLLNYNLSAFGGTAIGKGTILLDSDKSSTIHCKLNNLDLDALLTWMSKSLSGHFYSKVSGDIVNFSFNPKTGDINDVSFQSDLSLAQVKYVYHQSVLDSIQGIEDSLGPAALKKYIKKKRTGFEERDHHNINFKDVSSLKVSMKESKLNILPFGLVQKDDEYNFNTKAPIYLSLAPDKLKSKISGQLHYSFSNVFLKQKFPFLKNSYQSNLDGLVNLNGELALPVSAQEQARVQKDVAKKLAMAIDLGFLGKQIENGVRKLKNSQEIKNKIKDVKTNLLEKIKSEKVGGLLKGIFGSKNKKDQSSDPKEDKKESFKNLLKGLF
ncbi:MAG: hypothetical protein KC646_10785 [Candidatus Cloacimonetes bacterium]|nr:hypothetical protein [Candidatus Cloacimonadota bacterium]